MLTEARERGAAVLGAIVALLALLCLVVAAWSTKGDRE
jgi:hypothetical protein